MNLACGFALAVTLFAAAPAPTEAPRWKGVDETVIEKFAEEAGRPPWEPYINTDRGDLLLFLFLVAGAAGGFIAGYTFRGLFGGRQTRGGNGDKLVSVAESRRPPQIRGADF
jgi:hypothetical protein